MKIKEEEHLRDEQLKICQNHEIFSEVFTSTFSTNSNQNNMAAIYHC